MAWHCSEQAPFPLCTLFPALPQKGCSGPWASVTSLLPAHITTAGPRPVPLVRKCPSLDKPRDLPCPLLAHYTWPIGLSLVVTHPGPLHLADGPVVSCDASFHESSFACTPAPGPEQLLYLLNKQTRELVNKVRLLYLHNEFKFRYSLSSGPCLFLPPPRPGRPPRTCSLQFRATRASGLQQLQEKGEGAARRAATEGGEVAGWGWHPADRTAQCKGQGDVSHQIAHCHSLFRRQHHC